MSNHFDPAIEAELHRRRTTLRHDAEQHQLSRAAGRLTRPARFGRARTGHAIARQADA